MRLRFLILLVLMCVTPMRASAAPAQQEAVQTTWRLLDYVAVDYAGAVRNGAVISPSEYAEMREFTATAQRQITALPPTAARASLLIQSGALQEAVASKASAEVIATRAHKLGADLLKAYPVPLAPPSIPDLRRGELLFQTNCAACHGAKGRGDGPAAPSLSPRPVNFTDRDRAAKRSPFALEQVIDQGLDGTAMVSFAHLPAQDRWDLAFRVGMFAYPAADAATGEKVWKEDAALRAKIPNLAALAALTPEALARDIGLEKAIAVIAYLRANPAAVETRRSARGLDLTRTKLAESLAAYRSGNRDEAKALALSAYLDGFEPVEPMLTARDPQLMHRIETAMGELRSRVGQGRSVADVTAEAQELDGLFSQAEQALAPHQASSLSTFLSALTILVREGVEALLIVIAMIAFLRKAERSESLRYVHAGWAAALLAGGLTWYAATTLISISGASRELTEGFGGIFAAVVLVFVGIWMHGKSQANAWRQYVQTRMSEAVERESGWFLFGLAFVVVYREVFETILFFAAMWEESPAALLAGIAVGAAVLALIAWAMLRYSRKLPIGQFFRYSSILMAVLAVVLAGKGVAAIQEAGLLPISPVGNVPRIELLGLTPSLQVVAAQLLVIVALWIGFTAHRRRSQA